MLYSGAFGDAQKAQQLHQQIFQNAVQPTTAANVQQTQARNDKISMHLNDDMRNQSQLLANSI